MHACLKVARDVGQRLAAKLVGDVGHFTPGCIYGVKLSAENKLRAVEEGKNSMDPKLAIQPMDASATNGKTQFGSIEHIQQVENRRAVKVVSRPGWTKHTKHTKHTRPYFSVLWTLSFPVAPANGKEMECC